MKRYNPILSVLFLMLVFNFSSTLAAAKHGALDFGDYSSNYLVQKAWGSLTAKDHATAAIYAQKTVELYSTQALQMQADLKELPSGTTDEVFQYWALNDVGTALFILGEADYNSGKKEEAVQAFQKIIDAYSYSQCWDPRGWFWRIASVAQDKLDMVAAGVSLDFDGYDSNYLVGKAWDALADKKYKAAKIYVKKVEELYGEKAKEMQNSLVEHKEPVWKYQQKGFDYWALNDVGTAVFILAEAERKAGHKEEADRLYKRVIQEYSFARCWDRQGWFWLPADVAQKRLKGR